MNQDEDKIIAFFTIEQNWVHNPFSQLEEDLNPPLLPFLEPNFGTTKAPLNYNENAMVSRPPWAFEKAKAETCAFLECLSLVNQRKPKQAITIQGCRYAGLQGCKLAGLSWDGINSLAPENVVFVTTHFVQDTTVRCVTAAKTRPSNPRRRTTFFPLDQWFSIFHNPFHSPS